MIGFIGEHVDPCMGVHTYAVFTMVANWWAEVGTSHWFRYCIDKHTIGSFLLIMKQF